MNYCFVRETEEDIYTVLSNGTAKDWDVLRKIVPSGMSHTDLFSMSLYPYGFTPNTKQFNNQFYFFCNELKFVPIKYPNQNGEEEYYNLSYEYIPVKENPCHFQLFVNDENGQKLPRDSEDKKIQKRNSKFAKYIILNILRQAVCLDKNKMIEIPIKKFLSADSVGNGMLSVSIN